MKPIIAVLVILASFLSHAEVSDRVATRTRNMKTGQIELCYNHYLYSNSTVQERDCLIGKDDLSGNFLVNHAEHNGSILYELYCPNDFSEMCQKFGFRRGYFVKSKGISRKVHHEQGHTFGPIKFRLSSNCSMETPPEKEMIYELSDLKCLK